MYDVSWWEPVHAETVSTTTFVWNHMKFICASMTTYMVLRLLSNYLVKKKLKRAIILSVEILIYVLVLAILLVVILIVVA